MKVLVVNISDPSKEQLVKDILSEIDGVEVQRDPVKSGSKLRGKGRSAPSQRSRVAKPMTPKEKKFVKGLTQAFKDMDEHIAGKKKLKSLDEFLHEL